MKTTSRILAAVAAIASVAAVACGAPPDGGETTESTHEAIANCPAGSATCNPFPGSSSSGGGTGSSSGVHLKLGTTNLPETGYVCTTDSPADALQSTNDFSVSPTLKPNAACSSTFLIVQVGNGTNDLHVSSWGHDAVVSVCPAGVSIPTTLMGCEGELIATISSSDTTFCSAAVGLPDAGWELVIDSCSSNGIGGTCSGSCTKANQ